MERKDIDFCNVHNTIQLVRTIYTLHGLGFESCNPSNIAGGVLAVCKNKQEVEDVIFTLKELLKGYEQYYSPEVFDGKSNNTNCQGECPYAD